MKLLTKQCRKCPTVFQGVFSRKYCNDCQDLNQKKVHHKITFEEATKNPLKTPWMGVQAYFEQCKQSEARNVS